MTSATTPPVPPQPAIRRLRVYAFDPLFSTSVGLAGLNEATIELPWEQPWEADLGPGPSNEYLEVIDVDASNGKIYHPVDLSHPNLLAERGHAPSEANPQFHQQMVFAVAMKTIRVFERALGRRILWATHQADFKVVPQLRIYPHAMEERNAYYSPKRKALLFGYFRSQAGAAAATPAGQWVFTALSHDVVAHETTHAILDGLHRRFAEPTSLDSAAFHEGLADLVAIFSRLTNPVLVRHVLGQQNGRLDQPSILTGLARQYGEASGEGGPLRDCIEWDEETDAALTPAELAESLQRFSDPTKPHLRGGAFVAAIYDAFCQIYHRRAADLLGLADRLGGRHLDPVLLDRLTGEAVMIAGQVLNMSIRALDYLPPVDVRFGEFLRALITADIDLVPHDPHYYRLAFIEAFRRRGIVPDDCLSLAPDNLRWESPEVPSINAGDLVGSKGANPLSLESMFDRDGAMKQATENQRKVFHWLTGSEGEDADIAWEEALGVYFQRYRDNERTAAKHTIAVHEKTEIPKVEVHSVRIARRTGPDGQDLRQLVVQVTQRRRGYLDPAKQALEDGKGRGDVEDAHPDFWFRGGATILIDLREGRDGRITSIVRKRIDDDARLDRQRQYLLQRYGPGDLGYAPSASRASRDNRSGSDEPFAFAHRS